MADALTGTEVRDRHIFFERPDGSRVEMSVNTLSIRDQGGKVIASVNVFEDVSDSDPAALAELVERFRDKETLAAT
jgi:hypothetical protein